MISAAEAQAAGVFAWGWVASVSTAPLLLTGGGQSGVGCHGGVASFAGRGFKKRLKRFLIDRGRVQITLAILATKLFQVTALAGRFNPFGNHFQVEVMGKRHDQVHDFPALRVVLDVSNKGAIDFEHVDRKAAQTAERGMSRSEVVDAEPDAKVLELRKGFVRRFRIAHRHGFGDFKLQAARAPRRFHRGPL